MFAHATQCSTDGCQVLGQGGKEMVVYIVRYNDGSDVECFASEAHARQFVRDDCLTDGYVWEHEWHASNGIDRWRTPEGGEVWLYRCPVV